MPRVFTWTRFLLLGMQICCHASISMDCLVLSGFYGLLPNSGAQAYSSSTSCQPPWRLTMVLRFSSLVRVAPHTHPSRRLSPHLPNTKAQRIHRSREVGCQSFSTHPPHSLPPFTPSILTRQYEVRRLLRCCRSACSQRSRAERVWCC